MASSGEKRERVQDIENDQSNNKKCQRRLCEEFLKKNGCRHGVSIIHDFSCQLFNSEYPAPKNIEDFIDAIIDSTEDGSNSYDLLQSYTTAKVMQKVLTGNLPSYISHEKSLVSRLDYLEWRLLSFVERVDIGSVKRILSRNEILDMNSVLNAAIRVALFSECQKLDESLEWKIVESLVQYQRLDHEHPEGRIIPIHEMLDLNRWNFNWFISKTQRLNTLILDRLLHRGVFDLDDKWTRCTVKIYTVGDEVTVLEYAERHFKASVMHSLEKYLPMRDIRKMVVYYLF